MTVFKDASSVVPSAVVVVIGLVVADVVIDLPVSEIVVDERSPLALSVANVSVSPCANVISSFICEVVMVDGILAVVDVAVVGATVVCNCETVPVPEGIGGVVCIGKDVVVCVVENVDDIIFGVVVLDDAVILFGVGLVVVVCVVGVEDVVFKFTSSKNIPPRVLLLTG